MQTATEVSMTTSPSTPTEPAFRKNVQERVFTALSEAEGAPLSVGQLSGSLALKRTQVLGALNSLKQRGTAEKVGGNVWRLTPDSRPGGRAPATSPASSPASLSVVGSAPAAPAPTPEPETPAVEETPKVTRDRGPGPVSSRVIGLLMVNPYPMAVAEIRQALGLNQAQVRDASITSAERGLIVRVSRGVYAYPGNENKPRPAEGTPVVKADPTTTPAAVPPAPEPAPAITAGTPVQAPAANDEETITMLLELVAPGGIPASAFGAANDFASATRALLSALNR